MVRETHLRVMRALPVLPTRVGMVRSSSSAAAQSPSSPHPRGDGPRTRSLARRYEAFSPPAWGWSGHGKRNALGRAVLPTRVGMVRLRPHCQPARPRSPHPRGDGPRAGMMRHYITEFSPPAWGWSAGRVRLPATLRVLPTRVGMVRQHRWRSRHQPRSPHPRGDGPAKGGQASWLKRFSPPAWGWSARARADPVEQRVLPTRVGMVRSVSAHMATLRCSPHPRGDGPAMASNRRKTVPFSPPAWGWSAGVAPNLLDRLVLPTRVGMVRSSTSRSRSRACSPHPRGDGPTGRKMRAVKNRFSPPAWGWSGDARLIGLRFDVLPTRVGMVRHNHHPSTNHSEFSPPAWGWSDAARLCSEANIVLPTRVGMVRRPTAS